jgi:Trk K+ transport system NAD-binding subunit
VDVFRVRVGETASVLGRPLREVKLSPDWVVAAIQRNGEAHVPGADDVIHRGDVVLVVGREGREGMLRKLLAAK